MTRDERGVSDSVAWAVLTPLILLTVLGLIQTGLVLHGRTVAAHAAVAAAEEAALFGADPEAGRALGESLARSGGLADVEVRVSLSAQEVVATVAGRMPTFIDLGQTAVTAEAFRPRERVTGP